MFSYRACVCLAYGIFLFLPRASFADFLPVQAVREADNARHNQLAPQGKSALSADMDLNDDVLDIPDENPCYPIQHIVLANREDLPYGLRLNDLAAQAQHRCLGVKGIKALHTAIQNRLIEQGLITTRVLIPPQDLRKGVLTLRILPGRISDIVFINDKNARLQTANNFPDRPGDILDLRGLEQGLENLQRIPSAEASINLVPGQYPGETRIEVKHTQRKPWRLGAWIDDSGSRHTGRYGGGMAFYLDNPTSLNDLFYVAYGGGFKNENGRRNDNVSAYYSVPWGYWSLDLYASKYRTDQTIRSSDLSYQYSSSEQLATAQLNRAIYRSASQKTTLSMKAIKRDARYDLNDVEVEVQHRDTSSWKLSLEHQAWFSLGQVKASLGYQHAAPWFGQQADTEELVGSADPLARIVTATIDGTFPFRIGGASLSYEPHFLQQTSPDRLTQPDKLTLGNRWTVRGFDGETTIYADKGWYIRNDINLNLPQWGMQPYIGVDYGEVSGSENDYWSGAHIAGAVSGVRGVKGRFGYDLFAGVPLAKPDEMHTSPVTLGFSMQWQY